MKKTAIIGTKIGKIQGYIENGIQVFKGIPYAEPPLSELRLKSPVPKEHWDGVLNTIKYSTVAFQGYSEIDEWFDYPRPLESEDCLFLNVWTPSTDNKKRPVMFFIHGGAFVTGTGNDPLYDGSALARRGGIVVVTVNYRLGFFGFPYIPGKVANLGSLDQILALEWIRDNIAVFGGDPDNVTIFGQSAGGYSVISLCSMPAAKGLFRRVIAQSAPSIDPAVSDKITLKIFNQLGVKESNIEALREKSAQEIIDAQNKVFAAEPTNIMALRPLIEGNMWPKHPLKAFQEGDCADIDFMIGTTLDEAKMFSAMKAISVLLAQGESALFGYLSSIGVNLKKSKQIINTYKEARAGKLSVKPKDLFDAILTDVLFRIPTIRLLEAQGSHQPHAYNYMFTWPTPGMGGVLGSCHALELPFVFGTIEAPTFKEFVVVSPETKALSEKMMDAWISFARNGDPNHKNIPNWPAYDIENRATMVFGEKCEIVNAIFEKERLVWEGLFEI